ncbi:MAG: 2-oxo acid dehydrogenase subunit E2 [Fibrobacterota bacterium]|nr:MAG: 2-oxo acid dehydrogenase subunit E2 [Fibrobacterota bacterium]
MANAILMPRMSDSMVEGTLTKWLKNEGDVLKNGDLIAEIETDKATQDVECFEDGVLLKQTVAAGGVVPVGGPICIVGKAGEDISGLLAQAATDTSLQSSKVKAESATKAADEKRAPVAPPSEPSAPTTPVQPVVAAEFKNAARGAVIETQAMDEAANKGELEGRLRASPLARKIAAQKGISLYDVKGTGPGGRITAEDVQAALEGKNGRAKLAPVEGGLAQVATAAPRAASERLPLSNMRKTIARRLAESKSTIPHFYSTIEIDASPMMEFREKLNVGLAAQGSTLKITVNDLVLKAAALAAKEVPEVNASWDGDAIIRHAAVHLSFAVSLPSGLITPTIRDADLKPLKQMAMEAKELGKRAKDKGLKPEEFTGGTLTVSNLGMFGVSHFQAIVNPPQAVIMAVGAILKKPVVSPDGQIVAGQVMTLTLSGDHRVVDGSDGARYLQAAKNLLENPTLLLF